MLAQLKSLFGTRSPRPVGATPIAPDRPVAAIGDLHGRYDLLTALEQRLRDEADAGAAWVFLGDYVDRGPDSAGVLDWLRGRQQAAPDQVICLKGNHEKMMLDFIDDPAGKGARWLVNGGMETLASYGIDGQPARHGAEEALEAADALEAALPEGMQDWLRALPLHWASGNIHCVHAGMDPARAPEAQEPRSLLWGHPAFLRQPRADGLTVVHGHTIVDAPWLGDGRICVDTGAYRSGRLTAALLAGDAARFITVTV